MKPIFMWAGGKSKVLKDIEPHLPKQFSTYVEPFFGGGAMFIWAYKKNPEATFIINDVNHYIMEIYSNIKNDIANFISIVDGLETEYLKLAPPTFKKEKLVNGKKKTEWVPHNEGKPDKQLEKEHKEGKEQDWKKIFERRPSRRAFYFKVRKEYQEQILGKTEEEPWDSTKRSAFLYFLMKTGFNGVWQAKKGKDIPELNIFNTPCGLLRHTDSIYNKTNVLEWHEALQNVEILTGDFADTLNRCGGDTFVYLDPPYRDSFADYNTKKDDDFQKKVVKYFNDSSSLGSYCLLSNRDTGDGFFENLKGHNEIVRFDVTYTVGRKKKKVKGEGHEATKATEILLISRKTET